MNIRHGAALLASVGVLTSAGGASAMRMATETFPFNATDTYGKTLDTVSGDYDVSAQTTTLQGFAGTAEVGPPNVDAIVIARTNNVYMPLDSITLDSAAPANIDILWRSGGISRSLLARVDGLTTITVDGGPSYRYIIGPSGGRYLFRVVSFVANGAAVPEPATWAMMLFAFAGIGGVMRRRRHIPDTSQNGPVSP